MSLRASPVRFTLIPALAVAALGVVATERYTDLDPAIGWFVGINLVAFVVWWVDKRQAKREGFRVPEWTLHLVSVFGGGVGSVMAMRTLRHKTQKRVFRFVTPLLAALGVGALGWWLWR